MVPKAVARKAKVAGAKPPKENESRQVTAEIGLKRGFALEGTRALTFTTIQCRESPVVPLLLGRLRVEEKAKRHDLVHLPLTKSHLVDNF